MATRNQLNPPPLRKITDFKSKLAGGGARSNLFEVELSFPAAVGVADANDILNKARFLVKAAALPASNIAPISVPFRGRTLKIAGDRTFDEWTITVINDTDFAIRSSFERWMNSVVKVSDGAGNTNPEDYTRDAYVYQLGRSAVAPNSQESDANLPILRTYKFYSVFPTNISQQDLSYDQADGTEEFTVTLQVQWWEAAGNGGDVA